MLGRTRGAWTPVPHNDCPAASLGNEWGLSSLQDLKRSPCPPFGAPATFDLLGPHRFSVGRSEKRFFSSVNSSSCCHPESRLKQKHWDCGSGRGCLLLPMAPPKTLSFSAFSGLLEGLKEGLSPRDLRALCGQRTVSQPRIPGWLCAGSQTHSGLAAAEDRMIHDPHPTFTKFQ